MHSCTLGRKTRRAFFTPVLTSAFFTRSLRVFTRFFTQHKTVDLGENRWCGAARRSNLVVVRVWKFGSLSSLVFHARRATAEPYRSTPRPQKARSSMGVVLRLGRPLPPGFYHVFIALFTRFFLLRSPPARFLRVFYAFFTRFFFPSPQALLSLPAALSAAACIARRTASRPVPSSSVTVFALMTAHYRPHRSLWGSCHRVWGSIVPHKGQQAAPQAPHYWPILLIMGVRKPTVASPRCH